MDEVPNCGGDLDPGDADVAFADPVGASPVPDISEHPVVELAQKVGVEVEVALYALVMHRGVVVLNGSTSSEHMKGDLEGVRRVKEWAGRKPEEFKGITEAFEDIVG